MMEDVKTRRGEPVLVEYNGKWLPGYVEFGDGGREGISIAVEPGGGRFVLYGNDCRDRVRPDPGGERPLRDRRGIVWIPTV